MMNERTSSSEKCGTSSATSGDKPSGKVNNNLVCQIKEKEFRIYLIQVVSDNDNVCFGLKDFLKRVDVLSASGKVSKVLIELGFLMDQLQEDHLHKQDILTGITAKVNAQTSLWDAANASGIKVEAP